MTPTRPHRPSLSAVARVVPGFSLVSPLVVARCPRHDLLVIRVRDRQEEVGGPSATQDRRLSTVVSDDDLAVLPLHPREPGRVSHQSTGQASIVNLSAMRETIDGVDDGEVLHGGVANAGAVIRVGDHVVRPANPHSTSILRMLVRLAESGFTGASVPVGIDPDGRERLVFIPGDVAIPPYPAWAQSDAALASIARLLRQLHDVSTTVAFDGDATWSAEMADPVGGEVFCHNDVCLENVVFRDGQAVGLLDFDFAAPGRRVFDVASFARMCVPIDDDDNESRLGWSSADRPVRLRLVCDEYGLDGSDRMRMLACLDESIARGGEFVRRRVEAGEVAFIEMWDAMGGQERFDRRRRWWAEVRRDFEEALR